MINRFALVSHALPPSWSGQAIILGRILRHLAPSTYHLISCNDYQTTANNYILRLPSTYHHLPQEPKLSQARYGWQMLKVNLLLAVLVRAQRIARILRRHKCLAVIACSGDMIDLPASWLAGRLTGVPFIPYLFDDYTYQWPVGVHRDMAIFFERFIYSRTPGVIVPNEFLGKEIYRRHGVNFSIVRNCCDNPHLPAKALPSLAGKQQIDIVFTGSIYHMNFGSFRMLAQAVRRLRQPGVTLHLYTATDRAVLEEQGILGPQVEHHEHVPSDQVNRIQQEADLLFVPFAFDTPVWELAKTSAPGKLGDYLASGTPILGMAPPDSFTTWYLRKHEAGLVVDRDDTVFLDDTLRQALFYDELRRKHSENARYQAKTVFDSQKAAHDFTSVVKAASKKPCNLWS